MAALNSGRTRLGRPAAALVLGALLALCGAAVLAAPPAGAACATVTYKNVTYCVATIAELNAGAYPAGTRIALRPVAVLAKSGTTRTLGQVTATSTVAPCGGDFCGSGQVTCTETWTKTASDFASLTTRPVLGSAIDVYGKATSNRTLVPTEYVLVASSYINNASFHPCSYL